MVLAALATRLANRLKNRVTFPSPSDIDSRATLAALLEQDDDEDRWDQARGASVVGFVAAVKATGAESVNCGETNRTYTDTHIDIVLSQGDAGDLSRHVVVEVTPRWRAYMETQGENWSSTALRQRLRRRWVRFTGWLFWDFHHRGEARNTNPNGSNIWRATAWEIHPVTEIRVCPNNSAQGC